MQKNESGNCGVIFMHKLSLLLFSSSTLITSTLLTLISDRPALAEAKSSDSPAIKSQSTPQPDLPCQKTSCTGNSHLASYLKNMGDIPPLAEEFENLERTPEGHLILEISDEESREAIQMFGCDCITSINALRQLRGNPIGVEGDRILPGPKITPCSQQRAPEI